MVKTMVFIFKTILLFVSIGGLAYAGAEFRLDGVSTASQAFKDTEGALTQIITMIYYVIYLVGYVTMACAGFKLNAGDVAGFTKTFLGGAVLFCSPLIVKSLQNLVDDPGSGKRAVAEDFVNDVYMDEDF